eukprot:6469841-Amphidinium_carterae.2
MPERRNCADKSNQPSAARCKSASIKKGFSNAAFRPQNVVVAEAMCNARQYSGTSRLQATASPQQCSNKKQDLRTVKTLRQYANMSADNN